MPRGTVAKVGNGSFLRRNDLLKLLLVKICVFWKGMLFYSASIQCGERSNSDLIFQEYFKSKRLSCDFFIGFEEAPDKHNILYM